MMEKVAPLNQLEFVVVFMNLRYALTANRASKKSRNRPTR